MPEISIIVPVYNVEEYLPKCLDTILNQTFRDFEVILVNDGSKDNSGFICEKYAKKDSRIRIIHKENGGLSSARNAGLDIAKGRYIGFIDSDDFIDLKMYEQLYNMIKIYNADIAICSYECVSKHAIIKNKNYKDKLEEIKVFNNIEALNQTLEENGVEFIVAWNKLYKSSVFENLRFKEGKVHEDEFIVHQVLYKSNIVVYTPKKLYYYLQRENSITGESFNIKRTDYLEALTERIYFYNEKNLDYLKEKTEYQYLKLYFKYYFKVKNDLKDTEKVKKLKQNFIDTFRTLSKSNIYSKKEKLSWIIFIINSSLYEEYYKYKLKKKFKRG